jgi:predicted alpha/beta superfamily hydrolase
METRLLIRIFMASLIVFIGSVPAYADNTSTVFEIPRSHVHTIHSSKLGRTYNLYVKIPPGYGKKENASRSYPAIYLNDGPYTFQVASGVTRLPTFAGEFQPTILIGISFALGENGMASRVRDMTPAKDASWKNYETGGGLDYLSFIESEIIPFVEKKYRADPAQRALVGQSLGGSFGALVLLTKPYLFSNYILTSPSLWFNDRLIFELEKKYASMNTDLKARVYFATGSLETPEHGHKPMVSLQNKFVSVLRSRKYPSLDLKDEIIEGTFHETTFPIGFTRGAQWMYRLHGTK